MDYEKDMEVVWETQRLEELITKAKQRVSAHETFKLFLKDHPDFETFYNLMKKSQEY